MKRKIYGAPGTGKTTRMLDLLQKEVESGTPLDRIAFLTHTVSARLEAISRIKKLRNISDERSQLKYFRTIHGICYMENTLKKDNVMQAPDYLEFGETIGIPFSSHFTSDVDMDGLPLGFNLSGGNAILAVRQLAAARQVPITELSSEWPNWISPKLMKEVIHGYAKWKERHAKFDFVDMLLLYGKYGEPLDCDVMFIDEAQDLSSLQWSIVRKMFARTPRVYIAGDDDQSIYAFIGADRYGFLDFEADEIEILPKSYRLKRTIWNKAQNIIKHVSRRQDKTIEVSEGGHIDFYNNDLLYLDINHETMIIARHHAQLQRLAKSLEVRGIPYTGRSREIPKTDQALAVHAYFRARKGESISLFDASRLLRFAGDKDEAKRLRAEDRNNPGLFINKDQININWEAPWQQYLARNRSEVYKNELIRNILNNIGLQGLVDEPKVSLTTYHGCKGREADHVVCLTDCFKKAHDSARKNPEDETRLAYVGVTRAKERLTIVLPKTDLFMRSML